MKVCFMGLGSIAARHIKNTRNSISLPLMNHAGRLCCPAWIAYWFPFYTLGVGEYAINCFTACSFPPMAHI